MTTSAVSKQVKLNMFELNSQIMQGTLDIASNLKSKQSQTNNLTKSLTTSKTSVYASKGDSKYKAEMDSNNDSVITFNEYINYVNEQISSKTNGLKIDNLIKYTKTEDSETGEQKVSIQNFGKAIGSYLNNYVKLPESKINAEA